MQARRDLKMVFAGFSLFYQNRDSTKRESIVCDDE